MGTKEVISAGVGVAIIAVAGVWIWDRIGTSQDRRALMRAYLEGRFRAIEPNLSPAGNQTKTG